MKKSGLILLALALTLGAVLAQRGFRGGYGRGGRGRGGDYETARTPREIEQHGGYETPYWTNAAGFEKDTFTFVRIKRARGGYSGGEWWTDTPDSDLNFAYRLQQLTSIKVNPEGLFLRLTDKELTDYPFIYMVEPGTLSLDSEEIAALRKYLLNGGFLWLDDFWGDGEWANMEYVLKQVFPERSFIELPLDHSLYHCVFDIKAKDQVPTLENGSRQQYDPNYPIWENGGKEVHHRAIFDDKGRMMVFATHNTDNGDGWEWEGNNHYYFEHFSEKIAYPLAVNVIFYVMTH
jgi:Domain of unknown function (DUF4159)